MRHARILIADDEPLARSLLRTLIETSHAGEVVCEVDSVDQAVEAIPRIRPDLILLDIQMPEPDGFTVIARVGPDEMPPVVFVTAYEQYALRAFEVHAFDYLLKPVNPDRVLGTIERAMQAAPDHKLSDRLNRLLATLEAGRHYLSRIPIKNDGVTRFIDVNRIERIEASDKLLQIHTSDGRRRITRGSISGIEQQLDPRDFARVHRSVIVRLGAVQEVQRWFNDEFVLILTSGERVVTGAVYRTAVQNLLRGDRSQL